MLTKIVTNIIVMTIVAVCLTAKAEATLIYSEYLNTQPAISWGSIESMNNPGVGFYFYRQNSSFMHEIILNSTPHDFNFGYNISTYELFDSFVLQCKFPGWGDSNADMTDPIDLSGYIISSIQLEGAALHYEYSDMLNAIFINGYATLNIYGDINQNPTPEPSTLILITAGLGSLIIWRRKS